VVDFKRLSIAYRYDLHVTRSVLAALQKRTFVAFERAFLANPEKAAWATPRPIGQASCFSHAGVVVAKLVNDQTCRFRQHSDDAALSQDLQQGC